MADTRTQTEVEDWIRRHWMPSKFGCQFRRERIALEPGGVFDFDAVSDDDRIIASISTSGGRTSSGKLGVGKIHKMRSDMLFLVMAKAQRRVIILTEQDMYEVLQKEVENGRVPIGIEIHLAELPPALSSKLGQARETASREVRPRG